MRTGNPEPLTSELNPENSQRVTNKNENAVTT